MSLLLKAFPHGRPSLHARLVLLPALLTALALVVVLLPLAGTAAATREPRQAAAKHAKVHKKGPKNAQRNATPARKAKKKRAHAAPAVVGQPKRNYVMPATSYFSFPNRSAKERMAIRNRVLLSIKSVWGGRRNQLGTPYPSNGTIRIATWSFDDWDVARALVAAKKRGVSVQVVAAESANRSKPAWHWLRKKLGTRLYRKGFPVTAPMYSFARQCRGACRGPGGTPHSKYFLFDNVGAAHARRIVVQTSMNLTGMAYFGQWNQAQVMHSYRVYADFLAVFNQSRLGRPVAQPYHAARMGSVVDYFFPRPRATAAQDPVMQILNGTTCTGATTGGGRTMIRVLQYAIYGERGVWIAKKLRALWNAGCNVSIIYSVTSRPVLAILRNGSGRGAVPMRQSVVKDGWGNIVKYNHSKWMTIIGHWGRSPAAYMTFSGSANWANLAFGDDEQMQLISSQTEALRHVATFAKTWRQPSSSPPPSAARVAYGRVAAPPVEEEPTFGEGIYRYLPED
jgi:hypothetical protein